MLSFLVEKEGFYEMLVRVNRMISKVKKNLFVSPGVLLRVDNGNLGVFSTDMDSWLIQNIPVYDGRDGEVFIPVKEILTLLKNFKSPNVKISAEENRIIITGDGSQSQYEINLLNRDEFPELPDYNIGEGMTIDLEEFSKSLDTVRWCAAENDARAFLNGVYIHTTGGKLNFVASDGSILGRVSRIRFDGDMKIILPGYITDVLKLLNEGSGVININQGHLYIATNYDPVSITMIIRLIDEEYANYEELIPTEFIAGVSVNRDDITYAVERLLPFAPETGEMALEIGERGLTVSVLSAKGRGYEEIEGESFGNSFFKVMSFHLRDILRKIDTDKVDIKVSGENTPIVISPSGSDEVLFLTVPLI